MKRINIFILIFACLLCTASRCVRESDSCHKTINFVNNSSKEVYIHGGYLFPNIDTLKFASSFPNPYNQPNLYRVKQGEKNSNGLTQRDCLDNDIKQSRVIIYVFDAEVLANYSWGVIGRDYMVLKTFRPTIEEMERSNWTITFTGE
jgi:hypothetical protein